MRHRSTVFLIQNDNVLLLYRCRHGKEYYVVPGGGIESGETPEQAAIRELKEEVSLDIGLNELIGEFETDSSHEYFFIAKTWSGTPALGGPEAQRQSSENVYRLEWMPVKNLAKIDLRKEVREILLGYLGL